MGTLNFTKINGASNDFIIIDTFDRKNIMLSPSDIKNLCDRRKGIGADGLLLLDSSESADFQLKYFNSDGYKGSLCANGSRCAIKYSVLKNISTQTTVSFLFENNLFKGEILDETDVKLYLKEPNSDISKFDVKIEDENIQGYFIDTGSPHAVIFWDDINQYFQDPFGQADIKNFGKKIRYSDEFTPSGTNVNFICERDGKLFIRTYERGVEDETYSCGTGTVASSLVLSRVKKYSSPIIFNTYGKDRLIVNFGKKNDKFCEISLTGPVKINYIGSCNF